MNMPMHVINRVVLSPQHQGAAVTATATDAVNGTPAATEGASAAGDAANVNPGNAAAAGFGADGYLAAAAAAAAHGSSTASMASGAGASSTSAGEEERELFVDVYGGGRVMDHFDLTQVCAHACIATDLLPWSH